MPNYEAVRVQTVFSRQPIRGYILKKNIQIKLIAASIAMAASFQAYAGLGGLDVRSNLDEPFSGNIAVTGEEAKALLNGGSVTVSSSQAVRDPVLVFRVNAGAQVREYTAILDPVGYSSATTKPTPSSDNHSANHKTAPGTETKESQTDKAYRETNKKDEANTAGKTNVQHAKPVRNSKTHTVRKGETVKGIAAAIRPKHLTIEQVIDALLKANPDISRHGKLRAGSMLQIPNLNKIKAAAPKKVRKEYSKPQTEKSKTDTMPSEISQPAPTEKPLEKQATRLSNPPPNLPPRKRLLRQRLNATPYLPKTPQYRKQRLPSLPNPHPGKLPLLLSMHWLTKPIMPYLSLLPNLPAKLLPNLSNRHLPKGKPPTDC